MPIVPPLGFIGWKDRMQSRDDIAAEEPSSLRLWDEPVDASPRKMGHLQPQDARGLGRDYDLTTAARADMEAFRAFDGWLARAPPNELSAAF